ncbi:F-BAR domain only protein 2-like isoform X1 [Littorina saxatilis]|uniref:F-BAR domain only protein 2 n=1 Tax=Littorina saxatilis TaxID=31220 RepID=A0AAN9G8P8_9CAEN
MNFQDNFWGEKNNGFFVLYHNMKHGQTSVKELGDCLRESLTVEENYSKLLNKLTKNIANASPVGTFSPFWGVWKAFLEKLSSLHMQMMHTCSDLLKDMVRYSEEQHKKHKTMKENEQPTLEAVQGIQATLTAVHKAKEIYHTRCIERERLKRENGTAKEIEKAEQKYKKAHDEYKSLVEKYQTVKATFEKKMMESCKHFQELEEEHICQMKDFVDTYIKAWENQHVLLGQIQCEFKTNCDDLTVQKLINTFIEAKSTGKERPGPIVFVEPDLASLPSPSTRPMSPEPGPSDSKRDSFTDKHKQDSSGSPSPVLSDQPGPLSRSVKLRVSRTWFLKNKSKKKEKKSKKKKDKDEKDSESLDAESQGGDGPDAPQVDEDGYRIRPDNPMDNNGDKTSWNSSDSDSDSDDESRRKIKVAIRPLSPTNQAPASSNVEDIRASVQGLSLSPTAVRKRSHTPIDKKMKRSQSESDTLDKPNQDLLNLDFFTSSSSASTPTGANYSLPSPLSPQTEINWGLTSAPIPAASSALSHPVSSPGNLTDLFSTANGNTNSGILISNTPTPTPTPTPIPPTGGGLISPTAAGSALPGPVPIVPSTTAIATARPPSRNRGVIPPIPQKSQNGPTPISRSDSGSTFSTTSMPIGSSRGPSPLTIGMSDTIPLAVAFTDTINAYFKGTDATKCTVRMTGVLHMSFPIGIIKVFTENPNPPTLTFRLKNVAKLETVDHSGLVLKDEAQSTPENTVYMFDMGSLREHLRKQGEQSKTAYYNVEILRYQIRAKPGVESTPLPLVVYWKCEEKYAEWRLDYKYNPSAMVPPATIKNVAVVVSLPQDADVSKMQSHPLNGKWDPETKRATWKLNDISEVSEQETQGMLRAKFELKSGSAIKPATTMLQFGAEGANLSGVDFELVGPGYRISLTKKRFCTGKYLAEPEPSVTHV